MNLKEPCHLIKSQKLTGTPCIPFVELILEEIPRGNEPPYHHVTQWTPMKGPVSVWDHLSNSLPSLCTDMITEIQTDI